MHFQWRYWSLALNHKYGWRFHEVWVNGISYPAADDPQALTHWGRMMHICIIKLTIIGSYNGLSPGWRQAIIWANDGILLVGTLGTNFGEILSEIHTFSFKKMHLNMSSAKKRHFCLGLNVLMTQRSDIKRTTKEKIINSKGKINNFNIFLHATVGWNVICLIILQTP